MCLGGLGIGVYFVVFCIRTPTGIPETDVEEEIRDKVTREWEAPASAEQHEVFSLSHLVVRNLPVVLAGLSLWLGLFDQ